MNNKRIAAVMLPDFALELFLKSHQNQLARFEVIPPGVVLAESESDTAVVIVCNDRATGFGITTGMTIARAHSYCSNLVVGIRDIDRETGISTRVYQALKTIGPDIEWGDDNDEVIFFLEVSGLHRLYGHEEGIIRAIFATLTPFGYPVKIGIADNKLVARIAALKADTNKHLIVPSGGGGSWLRSFHLAHLPLPEETTETLHDLGIKTIGQAAAFPANEIARRFGHRGKYLTKATRGHDPDFFIPRKPTDDWRGNIQLDFPIRNTATILTYSKSILKGLLDHLHQKGLTCSSLNISLELEDHRCLSLTVATEEPTCSTKRFLRQLRSQLEQLKLTSSIMGLAIVIPHTKTQHLEQLIFEQQGTHNTIDPQACDTIDRALSGSPLCHIKLHTGYHLPESNFHLTPVSLSAKERKPSSTDTDILSHPTYSRGSIAGLRLIRPPQPADIYTIDKNSSNKSLAINIERKQQVIQKRSGPWKLSGAWWRSGFDRYYYELQTETNHRYLVFFDRTTTQWFLQGVYD